jgi:ribosomal subunit interface protein
MKTTISARHCEIPDDLKARASELIDRVSKMAHRPQGAEVIFNEDHQSKVVELILHLPRGQTRIASAEANDFQTALDRAVDKLKHQLEKDKADPKTGRRTRSA